MAAAKKKAVPKRQPALKVVTTPASRPAVKPAPKPAPKPRKSIWNASNQRAMYASEKSGYAKDLGLGADKEAVPVANEHGRQEGRLSPSERKYGVAQYQAVDAMTAQSNMIKRLRGELPPIQGGLDEHVPLNEEDAMPENFDPLGASDELEPGAPELAAEEQALAEKYARYDRIAKQAAVSRPVGIDPAKPGADTSAYQAFLDKRIRLTLELADGAMCMSAIAVKESRYGITILLPLLDDGATFIPKPGSEITVVLGERRWPCYFPGTYFECQELKLLGIVFVKAEES